MNEKEAMTISGSIESMSPNYDVKYLGNKVTYTTPAGCTKRDALIYDSFVMLPALGHCR